MLGAFCLCVAGTARAQSTSAPESKTTAAPGKDWTGYVGAGALAFPKYVGGKSTQGVGYYSGPCTPPGSPHHYTFVIIATDFEPKELPPGLTIPELWAKLPGHAKGAAGLVGLFVKP